MSTWLHVTGHLITRDFTAFESLKQKYNAGITYLEIDKDYKLKIEPCLYFYGSEGGCNFSFDTLRKRTYINEKDDLAWVDSPIPIFEVVISGDLKDIDWKWPYNEDPRPHMRETIQQLFNDLKAIGYIQLAYEGKGIFGMSRFYSPWFDWNDIDNKIFEEYEFPELDTMYYKTREAIINDHK